MIANIKSLEKYCIDYTKIENYDTAIKSPLRYDLHHRREISENKSKSDLIEENLYYNRPAEELIFIEAREHRILHKAGKHCSGETKKKMSDAKKGIFAGEKNPMFGKHPSAESRQKMSENNCRYWKGKLGPNRGKHWHLENGHRIYTE